VRELGRDEFVEGGDQLVDALRWRVELKPLHRDETIVVGIERAVYRTKDPGANLVEDAKRTESVRRRTGRFRVQ
jgi:hypothetical protein